MRHFYKIVVLFIVFPFLCQAQNEYNFANNVTFKKNTSASHDKINNETLSDTADAYYTNIKVLFVVSAGANITNSTPGVSGPYYQSGGKAYTSTEPVVSLGIDVFTNPNTGKLRFRLEAALAQSQYRALYHQTIEPYADAKFSYNELWASLIPQMVYNIYNGEDFKFYAGVGVSFSYYKYTNVFFGSTGSTTNSIQPATYYFNSFDDPILLKAGIQIGKHIGIYGNYLTTAATTRVGYFQMSKTAKQLGMSYFFK